MVLTEGRSPKGIFVKRAQRQVHGNLVHDIAPQKFRKAGVVRNQGKAGSLKIRNSLPIIVYKPDQAYQGALNTALAGGAAFPDAHPAC